MSLTLNQAALDFLLQNPSGPVGLKVRRSSEVIAGNYEAVVGVVWENQDASLKPEVGYEVSVGDAGLQSVIGIRFHGRISEYMARKMETEADRVVPSIMQGWDAS